MATTMEQMNVRLPDGVPDMITSRARELGISANEFIRQALIKHGIPVPPVPPRGRPARPEWVKGQRVILAVPGNRLGEDIEAEIDAVTPEGVTVGGAIFTRQPNGAWKTGSVGGFRTLRRVDG